jgi:hypothetical protein
MTVSEGQRVVDAAYGRRGTVLRVMPEGASPETLVRWDGGGTDWLFGRTELTPDREAGE